MSAKKRKERREARSDPYDDIDIFSGPAGQVLVDIDPLYGGIQQQKDEKPGDQAARDLTRGAADLLQTIIPQEKQAELEQQRAQQQAIYDQLLQVTGLEADSFEGQRLLGLLKRNKEFAEKMGFDRDIGTTDSPTRGMFDLGTFLFEPARDGLTTMSETGASVKDLPFEQQLGIFFLPIDALDVVGVGALLRTPLRKLLQAGVKKYGKNSQQTLKNLVDDKELMDDFLKENPDAEKFLEEFGFDSVGAARTPKSLLEANKPPDPKDRDGGVLNIKPTSIDIGQGQVDDALARANIEAQALQRETEKLKGFTGEQAVDPVQVRVETRGASPSILTSKADEFLLDNPNLSDSKVLEEFSNNPDVYLQGENVTRSNIKDRRKSLGIKRDRTKFPKLQERKQGMFEDFEKKITGGLDMEDSQAVYDAFFDSYKKAYGETKAVKNLTGENLTNDQLRSARKKFNTLINEYNDLDRGTEILNQQQINRQAPRTSKNKRKDDISMFNKYLTGTDEYKKIFDTLDKGDQKYFRRYLNFVRESALPKERYPRFNVGSTIVPGAEGNYDNFMKEFKPELDEMLDKNSSFYKDFEEFKRNDLIREQVGELVQPLLDKMFPSGGKKSIQIAHRFRTSQVGGTVPEGLAGSGGSPMSYYLDLSVVNYELQGELEKAAVLAVKNNDRKKMAEISTQAAEIGTEFVIDGKVFGKHRDARKQILDLVARAMEDKSFGVTQKELEDAFEAANIMLTQKPRLQRGGLITEDMNIFDDEEKGQILPRISIEFGDAALGRARRFGEEKPEDMVPLPLEEVQLGDAEPVKRDTLQEKVFDVQPMENIFTGEVEQANLKLPFFKLFTKPPVNETAPIPTPKESLNNPTKKQLQSLEQEKLNKEQDFFDPTPEDNQKVDLGSSTDVATTPKTNQALTGVFYSDAEKVLQRPDAPVIFPNKQSLLDYFAKNRIKKTELEDYGINNLLKAFDDVTPIPKEAVIRQIRSSPVRGMHVHGTGKGSEIINPSGEKVNVAYEGYREDGFIPGTTSERVLYIPMDKLPGDTAGQPVSIFTGESIQNHGFGLPGGSDSNYVVGWTRLSERRALLPTKLDAPTGQSKIPGLTRERERAQRQVAGLYAEAINKLNREGVRRGLNQADLELINQLSLEEMLSQYGDTLAELSPGLLDQIDDLIVKVRDLDTQITKASTVDASNVVKVQFADEIQSDIMQAAAGRKQKLLATLKKLQDEGRESTTLPELNRIGNEALAFFEKNKSVFRPLKKSQTEVDIFADSLAKVDAEVDDIINRFVETREISDTEIARVKSLLNDQIDEMINDLITVNQNTYEGLFPDLPFKKREEWADALIKKDLFELAYRKFVLKDPDVPDYYAITPDKFVIDRYSFTGNTSTSAADRAADKADQIKAFTERGEFKGSRFKGIGMSEFYGGPNAVDEKGKHYTSTLEKILKTQAKSNNSEMIVLNVQTKSGGSDIYRITDQNGNMVATLTDARQVQMIRTQNPNYNVEAIRVPDMKNTTPSFAIKITEEMLEPYKTHKAKGGFVEMIDIFEVA